MTKKIKDQNGNTYVEKKPFYKRIWFWLVIVILLLIGFGSASTSNNSKESTTTNSSQTSSKKPRFPLPIRLHCIRHKVILMICICQNKEYMINLHRNMEKSSSLKLRNMPLTMLKPIGIKMPLKKQNLIKKIRTCHQMLFAIS